MPSPVAEALFNAHKERASGWMTLTFWGRESKLLLKEGDLVGAQMGFGHQSVLQGLLQSKKLTLSQLDALWARASNTCSPDTTANGSCPAPTSCTPSVSKA